MGNNLPPVQNVSHEGILKMNLKGGIYMTNQEKLKEIENSLVDKLKDAVDKRIYDEADKITYILIKIDRIKNSRKEL